MRKVAGGLLVQEIDDKLLPEDGDLKVVTKAQPTEKQMEDLMLAWKIVKHAKSNGIAIAKDNQSLGIGPGQVNRIWSTQMAIERSGDKVRGAALASDAFFPFDDCVKACAEAGISCIIQQRPRSGFHRRVRQVRHCDGLYGHAPFQALKGKRVGRCPTPHQEPEVLGFPIFIASR